MLVKCAIEGKPKREFARKDDLQAEYLSSRKHHGTIFPETHHTQYSNPLPIYPEIAVPKEPLSNSRPQSLIIQLGQVRFERIAALLKSSEGDGDGILRRVEAERKTSSFLNDMLVWLGENTQARRAGCRESVELAERQVVSTHAQERRAREPETGSDVANQSRSNVSESKIKKRLFSSRPSMKNKRAYDSERIFTLKTMNRIGECV